jgi:hypothetical protein
MQRTELSGPTGVDLPLPHLQGAGSLRAQSTWATAIFNEPQVSWACAEPPPRPEGLASSPLLFRPQDQDLDVQRSHS